jgi:hypothetical protein
MIRSDVIGRVLHPLALVDRAGCVLGIALLVRTPPPRQVRIVLPARFRGLDYALWVAAGRRLRCIGRSAFPPGESPNMADYL